MKFVEALTGASLQDLQRAGGTAERRVAGTQFLVESLVLWMRNSIPGLMSGSLLDEAWRSILHGKDMV